MSTDNPYNELGQILSEGGEIAVGLAIIQDTPLQNLLFLITRKFGGISDSNREQLIDFAQSMVDAGADIQGRSLDSILSPEDIPLNSWLFGGDLQGRRAFIVGEIEVSGLGFRIQARLPFEDIPTLEELRAAFQEEALRRLKESPDAFGIAAPDTLADAGVYILLPQRAF